MKKFRTFGIFPVATSGDRQLRFSHQRFSFPPPPARGWSAWLRWRSLQRPPMLIQELLPRDVAVMARKARKATAEKKRTVS
jgi:hypothetical protein